MAEQENNTSLVDVVSPAVILESSETSVQSKEDKQEETNTPKTEERKKLTLLDLPVDIIKEIIQHVSLYLTVYLKLQTNDFFH